MITYQLLGAAETRLRLAAIPVATRRNLGRELDGVAASMLTDMRSRASSSERIPSAITTSKRFGAHTAGFFIRVDAKKAPHARVHAKTSTFRHPVFGSDVWVSQDPLNFWQPPIKAGLPAARRGAQKALTDAVRRT